MAGDGYGRLVISVSVSEVDPNVPASPCSGHSPSSGVCLVMSLHLDIHDVGMTLESSEAEFLDFVARNYGPFIRESVTPKVRVMFSREAAERARNVGVDLPRYGDGLFASQDALFWKNEFGFESLVKATDDGLEVLAHHSGLDHEVDAEARLRNFQRSMRWAVHFPIFALQRRDLSRHLTHAAAVAGPEGAWVFAGLNGVGKSTLAARLLDRPGWSHVADNFLLGDASLLYPFPEVIRLSEASLRAASGTAVSTPEAAVYGKHHLRARNVADPVAPHAAFLVTNTSHLVLELLDPMRALLILRSLHDRLQEFPEYGHFAVLPVLDRFDHGPVPTVPPCLGAVRWYRLGLPLDWNLDSAIDRILACV